MKIEEAIVYCLATSNRGMSTEQIADMINRQRLHLTLKPASCMPELIECPSCE